LGLALIVFPNDLLSLFQMPTTTEPWIRVVGMVAFNIGLLYIFMAPVNNAIFYTLTIYTRASVLVWFVVFVLVGWAEPPLILFGAVDVAGAAWTYITMRNAVTSN
jgi:hypothetical protein